MPPYEGKVEAVKDYEPPSITVLGSIQELTQGVTAKIGPVPDAGTPSLGSSITPR